MTPNLPAVLSEAWSKHVAETNAREEQQHIVEFGQLVAEYDLFQDALPIWKDGASEDLHLSISDFYKFNNKTVRITFVPGSRIVHGRR